MDENLEQTHYAPAKGSGARALIEEARGNYIRALEMRIARAENDLVLANRGWRNLKERADFAEGKLEKLRSAAQTAVLLRISEDRPTLDAQAVLQLVERKLPNSAPLTSAAKGNEVEHEADQDQGNAEVQDDRQREVAEDDQDDSENDHDSDGTGISVLWEYKGYQITHVPGVKSPYRLSKWSIDEQRWIIMLAFERRDDAFAKMHELN